MKILSIFITFTCEFLFSVSQVVEPVVSQNTTIILALIATIVPTVTVVMTFVIQKARIEKVHTIVNSQKTAMERDVKDLKEEIARLNVDRRGTPGKDSGSGAAVTLDKGVVGTQPPIPSKT